MTTNEYWVVSVPNKDEDAPELVAEREEKAKNQREAIQLAKKNSVEFGSASIYNGMGFFATYLNGEKWKLNA